MNPRHSRRRLLLAIASASSAVLGEAAFATGLLWLAVQVSGGTAAAIVAAAMGLTMLVLMPVAGMWLDSYGRTRVMVRTDLLRTTCLAAAAVVGSHGVAGLPVLFLVAVVVAAGSAVYNPGILSLVADAVPEEQMTSAVARLQAATRAGRIGGPLLGGILAETWGLAGLSMMAAGAFAVSACCLAALPGRRRRSVEQRRSPWRAQLVEGIAFIRSSRSVSAVIALGVVTNAAISSFAVSIPIYTDEVLGGDGSSYGLLVSSYQGAMLITALLLGAGRIAARLNGGSRAIAAAMTVLGGGFVGLAVAPSLAFAMGAVMCAGAGLTWTSTLADTRLVTGVPAEIRGRVFGASRSLIGALRPVGSVSGGILSDLISVSVAVGAAGALVLAWAGRLAIRRSLDTPAIAPGSVPPDRHDRGSNRPGRRQTTL